MMMVSLRSRPTWERSFSRSSAIERKSLGVGTKTAYLYIVALMVIAIFAKQSVMDDMVDVKLVEKRVPILKKVSASTFITQD